MLRRIPLLLLATLLTACGVEAEDTHPDTTASAQQQELSACGDGICAYWENSSNCSVDCYCGDGFCHYDEAPWTCAADCSTFCGDMQCNGAENTQTCPEDCR